MRLFMLHNPAASRGGIGREDLLRVLRRHGHDVICCSSKDRRWRKAIDDSVDLLVAAGGDGTVAKLGRTHAARRVPIAVLPLGTANNISSALHAGVQWSPEALIAAWPDAERRSFDLGVARGPWGQFLFLESVGMGLLAELMAEVEDGERDGTSINDILDADLRLAAARRVCEHVLADLEPVELELTIDGRRLSGRYVLMEALNFGAAGPNLRLTPTGKVDDGLLDLVLVGEEHRSELNEHLHHAAAPAGWEVYQAEHVLLQRASGILHLDDQLERHTAASHDAPIELTVEPHALTFLVPHPRRSGASAFPVD